jgi:AraC-like DNA-binding protein
MENDILTLSVNSAVKVQNGGLFISRGKGIHPTRVIQSHEIIFVKQGVLEMWEEERTFAVEADQILHLYPHRLHGGLKTLHPDLKFYWIHFEIIERENDTPSSGFERSLVEVPQTKTVSRPEKLETLFRYFLDEQESPGLCTTTTNLLMEMILVEIARAPEVAEDDKREINIVAAQVHNYIRFNYDRPISVSKISEALRYNPDYLGRVYHRVYGCTITDAIHRRRIKMACRYLLDTPQTIEQIAQACGFSNPDYFRRIFRRLMNISPTQYRDLFTRAHVNTH